MVMVMVMNDLLPPPLCNINRPSHSEIQLFFFFKIWPWKSMAKIMYVVKGQGHVWPSKFKGQVMVKVKPDGPIWALEFDQYVCFSVRGNRNIFCWDIANSRSWPRQTLWSHLSPKIQSICLRFVSWQSDHFGWDIANSIFNLEKSRSRSRRKLTKI